MNAPEKKPQPRWARRKDARPEEIIAAALDLFVERGFAATRLDDVAAHAGVSKGTLYLYFENKEDLFKAVVRGNILPLLQHGEALVESFAGSSGELLQQLVRGWWEYTGSTKIAGIPKLIIAEAGNFPDPFLAFKAIAAGGCRLRQHLPTFDDLNTFNVFYQKSGYPLQKDVSIMLAVPPQEYSLAFQ